MHDTYNGRRTIVANAPCVIHTWKFEIQVESHVGFKGNCTFMQKCGRIWGDYHKPLAGQAALPHWIQYRIHDRMPCTTYYSLTNMYRELGNRYVIRRPYVTRSTNRSLTAQRLQAWCTCSFGAFTCALVLPEASHESSLYKNLSFSLGPIVDY